MTKSRAPLAQEARRPSLTALVGSLVLAVLLAHGPMAGLPGQFLPRARAATAVPVVGFADLVEKVKPAVISVRVRIEGGQRSKGGARQQETPLEKFLRRFGAPDEMPEGVRPRGRVVVTGQGSGFFVSADGYAVTNFHVVDGADKVEVTTDDGRNFTAKVIGADASSDIAVIKVEGADLPYVRFANTLPRIGDWVIAVGNPYGLGGSVTAGIVSGRGRDIGTGPYDDYLQIDAAVNRGNSGGPTFDLDGNVVGVNSAIVSPSGGSVGIAFAVPADTVKSVVTQLKEKGKVARGWIGVQIQDVTSEIAGGMGLRGTQGALVAEPQPGAPAAKAGIESGDVVTQVDGKRIADARDLAKTISAMPPGTAAKVTVLHEREERTLNIVLGNAPETRQASAAAVAAPKSRGAGVPRLGVSVAPSGNGAVVTNVDPDGPAAEQVMPGDVILQANGRKVASAADLRGAIDATQKAGKRVVLMRVKSGDGVKFVAVPVGQG